MPGRLGPDLVASLPAETRHVFVTAHEQHAAAAFHRGAVDYVLKPFDAVRLAITLGRLRDACSRPVPAIDSEPHDSAEDAATVRLVIAGGREVVLVPLADVVWIEACQNYKRVQTIGRAAALRLRQLLDGQPGG
jgi:DNA-binding LytR/AlgR family response regulator